MERLIRELQRLYFLPGQQWADRTLGGEDTPRLLCSGELTPAILAESCSGQPAISLQMLSPEGLVRVMVVNFRKSSDWAQAAQLHQAVQDELELPEPAISVSGRAGYRLWFSLAEPLPLEQVSAFLQALRRHYLADLRPSDLCLLPADENARVTLVPAFHHAKEKWSAFIQPSLGAMFVEAPGLEMAPNPDRQADALAGLKSIRRSEFERAMEMLGESGGSARGQAPGHPLSAEEFPGDFAGDSGSGSLPREKSRRDHQTLNVGSDYTHPKSFLLAVMNDPSASPRQRIRAAKALLPYFGDTK